MGTTLDNFVIAVDNRVRREIVLTLEAFAHLRLRLNGADGPASQKSAKLMRLYLVNQFVLTVMLMIWLPIAI